MSGAEALYAAAALYAGGTVADQMAKQKAEGERRSILNKAFEDNRRTTEKSAQMLADEGAKMTGDARQAAMADQEAAAYAQTQKDLSGAGGDLVGSATGGNVSSDFMKAKADKALSEGNRLTAIAKEAAKVRSPGDIMMTERQRQADLLGRTGSMWGRAKNMTGAAIEDAQAVREPWYGTAGKIAKQAAMMYAMSAMGGAGGAAGGAGGASGSGTAMSGSASVANFA